MTMDEKGAAKSQTISVNGKILHIILLFGVTYYAAGCLAIVGATLPDLQCILKINLKTATALLFANGLGQCLSSLCCFVLGDMVDWTLVLISTQVFSSVAFAVLPICKFVSVAIVLSLLCGWCTGISSFVRLLHCTILWPKQPATLFFITTGTSLGLISAPLVADLFVYKFTPRDEITLNSSRRGVDGEYCREFHTNIEYVYLLMSSFGLCIATGLIVNYYNMMNNDYTIETPKRDHRDEFGQPYSQPYQTTFLILLLTMYVTIGASLMTFTNLLVSYGVRTRLNIGLSTMIKMSSAFSFSLFLSRILSTFLSGCISLNALIPFYLVLLNIASVLFVVFKDSNIVVLWISCILYAFGLGPMYPWLLSWSRGHVEQTSCVIASSLLANYIGKVAHPSMTALLMGTYGPNAFMYCVSSVSFLQSVLLLFLFVVSAKMNQGA